MGLPFTEEHEFRGASWAQVAADPRLVELLRRELGLAKGADVKKALLDPGRVRRVLATLPPAQLLAIRSLLVVGGAGKFTELRAAFDQDVGVPVDELYPHLLDVGVLTGHTDGHPGAFIVREIGPALIAALWPLGLPERAARPEPSPDTPVDVLDPSQRLMLVLAGRLAHQPLKVTRGGRANKTSLKRFVKGSSLSLAQVGSLIEEMQERELIDDDEVHLFPLRDRLVEHCRPVMDSALHESLAAMVDEEGALPLAAAIDAVKLQIRVDGWASYDVQYFYGEALASKETLDRVPDFVAQTPGVRIEGDWMLPASTPVDGDGFVTPAFDVMVGPGTAPEVLLTVAMAASLRSVEQMVSFHLEPASVAGARRHGVDATEILHALDRLCPHPVPDNVAHMVEEWSAAAKVARVRRVWVVEGADEALASSFHERVEPGRFLATGDFDDIERAVRAAGLEVTQPATAREARERDERRELEALRGRSPFEDLGDPEDDSDVTWFAPCWFSDGADPRLAEAVAAAQRGDRPWVTEVCPDCGQVHDEADEFLHLLNGLVKEAAVELRAAAKRFSPSERARLDELIANSAGELQRFFTLSRKWRRRAVKRVRSVDELLARVDELWSPGRMSEAGTRAHAAAAALGEALRGEPPTLDRLQQLASRGTPLILHLAQGEPVAGTIASVQQRRDGAWVLLDAPLDSSRGHSIPFASIESVVAVE